jgi:hypothetical protein
MLRKRKWAPHLAFTVSVA